MRTPIANKSRSTPAAPPSGPGPCPFCGRPAGGHCRPVPLGWWCLAEGLVEDQTRRIFPAPDPVHEAVGNDPEVVAAADLVDVAAISFDQAEEAWQKAAAAAAEATIRSNFVINDAGELVDANTRRQRRKAEQTAAAERKAWEAREEAGAALVKARVAHQDATAAARFRLTGQGS